MFVMPISRTAAIAARSPSMSRAVDRFIDESFDRFLGGARALAETRTPTMDVSESDVGYTVTLDVPGVTREQLAVSVEGRRVAISSVRAVAQPKSEGEAAPDAAGHPPVENNAGRVIYRERSTVAYARTIVLPAEVDQTASQAKFENGVLTLTLAKKVATGASRLAIA